MRSSSRVAPCNSVPGRPRLSSSGRARGVAEICDNNDVDDDEDSDTTTFGPPTVVDEGSELTAEQLKAYLEHLRPEDFGKFNL